EKSAVENEAAGNSSTVTQLPENVTEALQRLRKKREENEAVIAQNEALVKKRLDELLKKDHTSSQDSKETHDASQDTTASVASISKEKKMPAQQQVKHLKLHEKTVLGNSVQQLSK